MSLFRHKDVRDLRVTRTAGDFPQCRTRACRIACCTTTCCATIVGGGVGLLAGIISGLVMVSRRKLREIPADIPTMQTGLVKLPRGAHGSFEEHDLVPVRMKSVFFYYAAAYATFAVPAAVIMAGVMGSFVGRLMLLFTLAGIVALAVWKTRHEETFRKTRMIRFGRIMLYIYIYAFFGLLLGAGVGLLFDMKVL